jgi:negative regulator of flagellin synthesis FlgM
VTPAARAASTQNAASDTRGAQAPISTSVSNAGPSAPIDQDRVKEIRKALETGTYPLIPTEIADALIASGLYGKVGK